MHPTGPRSRPNLPVLAVLVASTALLARLAGQLLGEGAQWVGHDYSYFFPYLVAGSNWIQLHGWAPPFFTPDFCGGLPWLGNPQSVFYSVPQWLATIISPIGAARWTLIIFATLGAGSTYFLLRRCFRTSSEAAALGFVLFQLDGFLIFRMAIGHLPFHVFGLAPLVAMLVLWPTVTRRQHVRTIAIAAICLAAMVFGGGGVIVVPIVLAVAAVIALAQLRTGTTTTPWVRLGGALLWSLPLAAIKIVPALILMRHFPRSDPPAIISSVGKYLLQFVQSLFLPGSLQPFISVGTTNLNQHEFEYGVSLVPLLLIGVLLVRWLRKRHRPRHQFPVVLLGIIAVVVTALSLGSGRWAMMLRHIPIVASTSVGTRWWVVWMLALVVAAALALDAIARIPQRRVLLMIGCSAVVLLQAGLRPLARYTEPTTFSVYNPAPARDAAAQVRSGKPLPAIDAIARPVAQRSSDGVVPWVANDGVFTGKSYVPCYEPLFDHDLRLFPAVTLTPGPAFPANGAVNLADPRCYFSPDIGGCRPGSRFPASDGVGALKFAEREGLEWQQPRWQRVASSATVASTVGTLLIVLASFTSRTLSANRRR